MENKLIPLTEFVNRIDELVPSIETFDIFQWKCKQLGIIKRYSAFISQPLKLEYFLPVKDGEVLKEPKIEDYDQEELEASVMGVDVVNYQEAKPNVLFGGFEMYSKNEFYHDLTYKKSHFVYDTIENRLITGGSRTNDKTIENIVDAFLVPIELTETALKQIYG